LPAWFEFGSLEPVSKEDFTEEFGRVPGGDPTLLPVWEGAEREEIAESGSEFFHPAPIAAPGNAVLHISDLHFGDDYGFPLVDATVPAHKRSLETIIVESLKEESIDIGVVVLSGDITTKGKSDGYVHAAPFLERLLSRLQLTRNHLVMVPGNHDIYIEDTPHPTRDHEEAAPYRLLLGNVYGTERKSVNSIQSFNTKDWCLTFCGLNSARPRSKETKEYGYVGDDRYQPLLDEIATVGRDRKKLLSMKRMNFAVLHHHLLPANGAYEPEAGRPVSMTLDAGGLVESLIDGGIHVALHGHQHIPFVGTTSRVNLKTWSGVDDRLWVIGCGSTGAAPGALAEDFRDNTYMVHIPEEDGLLVKLFRFTSTAKPSLAGQIKLTF